MLVRAWLTPGLVVAVGVAGLSACGDNTIVRSERAEIAVTDGPRVVTAGSTVTVSADIPARIAVKNTGNGVLELKEIIVEGTPAGAFSIISLPSPSEAAPVEVWPDALGHSFSVAYDPSQVASGVRASATVRIRTNVTLNSGSEFTFEVAPAASVPKLVVSPPILDFGAVPATESAKKTVNVLNTGSTSLEVSRVVFAGAAGFKATIEGNDYSVTAESASSGITLSPPLAIAPGSASKVDVTYFATDAEAAQGRLVFFANDAQANGTEVKIYANLKGPCIKVNPTRIDFGGRLVGSPSTIDLEVTSCGDVDLLVSDIALSNDANGRYTIDRNALGLPLTIGIGQTKRVPVTYFPESVAAVGAGGQFVRDEGLLKVSSNAYLDVVDVPLTGFGTDGSCPIAVITSQDAEEVIPQTNIRLSARSSTGGTGGITKWQWTVVPPSGAVSAFLPDAQSPDVTYEANIVGEYIFRLKVWDAANTESCAVAERRVLVSADSFIHVELLWHTPGDVNEADEGGDGVFWSAGSDVDLHLAYPFAVRYFDSSWDCYFASPLLEWGALGPSDNPRLDRDDTDGAGPENLNIDEPDTTGPVRYRVGVHYWNDWSYGASMATVRIYIWSVLREEWANVRIVSADLWESHTIDAQPNGSAVITRVTGPGGAPKITPNYPLPL